MLVFRIGVGDWVGNMAAPTGLKHECLVYRGFTPAATGVPPLRGSYWMGLVGIVLVLWWDFGCQFWVAMRYER